MVSRGRETGAWDGTQTSEIYFTDVIIHVVEFLIAESYQAGQSCPFLSRTLILSPFITRCQTNVYPSARRRKMRPFEGFTGKAIVVVPTDEEFQKRIEKRTKEEGKDVPEHAVLEMKGRINIADSTQPVRQSHSYRYQLQGIAL